MAYKIYNMYDDIKDSYKDVHEDDEINASCELPRVNNAFFSDNYDSSMNERKQSLIQLRSPINQKLLEEQSYYDRLERKNSMYVKRNVSEQKVRNASLENPSLESKPLRIWFTSDQSRRHPKINLPQKKNAKINAFRIN